jgi:cell volume regulation protein A
VEIDLPGQLEFEMVGYPVLPRSPILKRQRLPAWVRPVFVVRDNKVLTPEQAQQPQPGDYGYFLVSPKRVARLDRLFAPRDTEALARSPGIFLFKGDVRMADVAGLYDLALPEDLRELSVAEAFIERFENRLEVGDTIQLGPAALVVLETDEDFLISAALEVDDLDAEEVGATLDEGIKPEKSRISDFEGHRAVRLRRSCPFRLHLGGQCVLAHCKRQIGVPRVSIPRPA